MLRAGRSRPPRRMEWEPEEHEAAHAGHRLGGLRLRRHSPAERFPAGEDRQTGRLARRLGHRCADRLLRYRRWIRAVLLRLHIGKLEAMRGYPAGFERLRGALHEWMVHAGARAMREHVHVLRVSLR